MRHTQESPGPLHMSREISKLPSCVILSLSECVCECVHAVVVAMPRHAWRFARRNEMEMKTECEKESELESASDSESRTSQATQAQAQSAVRSL